MEERNDVVERGVDGDDGCGVVEELGSVWREGGRN